MLKSEDSLENITLTCQVRAQPDANVVFFRDNRNGDRMILYSLSSNDSDVSVMHDSSDTTTYKLEIFNIEISQFGDYSCSADNFLGSDSKTVQLSGIGLCVEYIWLELTLFKLQDGQAFLQFK